MKIKRTLTFFMIILLCLTLLPAYVMAEDATSTPQDDAVPAETQPAADEETVSDDTPAEGTQKDVVQSGISQVIKYYKGEILKVETLTNEQEPTLAVNQVKQICQVKILVGSFKNRVYEITSTTDTTSPDKRIYETGDSVMISAELTADSNDIKSIYIYDFYRVDAMLVMVAVVSAVLIIIGLVAGLRLVGTILLFAAAYQFFFVPLMLKGVSPILLMIPICLVIIAINIFSELGFTKNALIAFGGTMVAVIVSSLIGLYAEGLVNLVGLGDSELALMEYMPDHTSMNFTGLTFSLTMLMSIGAAMSVSCTICESLAEATELNMYISRSNLFKYGMHSGRNILSRSLLSLFFASFVSVVPTWLVYAAYNIPIYELMNLNHIASQLFKIAACLCGISVSVPFTSLIYSYAFRARSLY